MRAAFDAAIEHAPKEASETGGITELGALVIDHRLGSEYGSAAGSTNSYRA
jgi:hypothetical protein